MVLLVREGNVSRVMPALVGRPVVCIATGPSLTREQVELVRAAGAACIVVNDAYLIAPFADAVYFADVKWYRWQLEGKDKPELGLSAAEVKQRWKDFKGQKVSIQVGSRSEMGPEVFMLLKGGQDGLSQDPGAICTGSHSGYQAMNIAYHTGADPIILLGYDCKSESGKDHFFGAHPDKSKPPYGALKERYRVIGEALKKAGRTVINCSPDSAIEAFERKELAACLQPAEAVAVVSA